MSKTAIGPQPEPTVLAGVFDSSSSTGKIRLSALKQFGLLDGTTAGYAATQLAKNIEAAPDETAKKELLRRAALSPKVYHEIFNTYHGDLASRAQIRSRALALEVHPDVGDACSDLFIASALTAGIATAEGDNVRLISATETVPTTTTPELPEKDREEAGIIDADDPDIRAKNEAEKAKKDLPRENSQGNSQDDTGNATRPRQRVADITLNLTVDSSLDGEKLEKQLALLRRFGLI